MNGLTTLSATAITFLLVGAVLMAVASTAATNVLLKWKQAEICRWQRRAKQAEARANEVVRPTRIYDPHDETWRQAS